MNKLSSLLTLASLLAVAAATASAQDNTTPSHLTSNTFDTAASISGLGQYSITTNQGAFAVDQGRLEYSAASAASSRVLTLNGAANSGYTSDWTASLTLTNLAVPVSGYNLISMQVFSANADSGFFNIGLFRSSTNGAGVILEKGRTSDGTASTYTFTTGLFNNSGSDFSDVLVRLSHDASTKDITFAYSLDAGATYQSTFVMNPTSAAFGGSWFAAPTDGYSFRVLARNTVDTIPAATMFADNFSVTPGTTAMVAVPEPSTYAAIAGAAALGLAFWHRRRQARRTS
jgi:hypothetical protein